MRSAPPPSRPASNRWPTSTPATTRAAARFTSIRSAAGAGRRRAPFSSRCSIAAICGLRPVAWSKPSCSTAAGPPACVGGKAGKRERRAAAAKSILAAGSIGSPQSCCLSGIGPAQHLHEHGIAGRRRPAGRRRQSAGSPAAAPDLQGRRHHHAQRALSLAARLARHACRICAVPARPADHGAVATRALHPFRSPTRIAPICSITSSRLSLDRFGEPLHGFPRSPRASPICGRRAAALCGCARAILRAAPAIKPNYLSTDDDRRIAAKAIRLTRRIVGAAGARGRIIPPNICPATRVRDDDEPALEKAAGDIGTTIFHPVGTAKMGLASDP